MAVFAIVGAGLSGMTLARELTAAGHHCQVFEKSRGRGGRLATRRREGWQADHGAQFFTVRDNAFQKVVDDWEANGWVQPWAIEPLVYDRDGFHPAEETSIRYVGTPSMNAMVLGMSEGIDLFLQTRVDRLERVDHQWRLWDDAGEHYGQFDAVFLTAPLAQSLALLPSGSRAEVPLRGATMLPTWSMALAFEDDTGIESDGYFVQEGVINWAARDSSKPGREPSPEVWVMHFSPTWTGNHLDAPDSLLQQQCLTLLRKLAPRDLPELAGSFKHRWLYARSGPARIEIPQWDERLRIGLAGDWILGDRLEDAWQSAVNLAHEVIEVWQ
ncbi:NAD(P)/FAD-dependent oxidoreductase [Saccharospirillum salsuginis]|uniref:FAD-dependent oxidoreductase n=1 Tax=Saccharospirillum salsuginis TaxID=418750 RepID=A0A918N6V7_9GAMM|nr:FAD-dependent oxidoreductase [Saccharospirillum salsuginis]GGX48096.1 FAD-dependent oxidoreductase [Saccharospirillum salsuginis]